MYEFDVYEINEEYEAVRSTGFFCWQALLVSILKIPFSSAIYPFFKGHKKIALIAFSLEFIALLLILIGDDITRLIAIVIIILSTFGISIGYYAILRAIAKKYYGTVIGNYCAATEEQAISEALREHAKN